MKRTEVTLFLEYLRAHDPYLEINAAVVQAWADALDGDMTADFARQHCIRHYRQEDAPRLTPAGMNTAWSWEKRRHVRSITAPEQASPMPDWFREQFMSGGAA